MRKRKNLLIILLFTLGLILVSAGGLIKYFTGPVSKNSKEVEITIEQGTYPAKIGEILESKNLIRNATFFKLYTRLLKVNNLKAGTYTLNKNMEITKIIDVLMKGNSVNLDEIEITFKNGINMRDIATVIAENTNNTYDEVMEKQADKEYLQKLINDYWFLSEDILDSDIYYPLEGYMYPDTYRFASKSVSIDTIFRKLLTQMDKVLEPEKDNIKNNKYSLHEILTFASVAELEVRRPEDRKNVISVFMNRYEKKIQLGSDITTRYSLKVPANQVLSSDQYNTINAYNTRSSTMAGKLPAGPIATISKDTIYAAINPVNTGYLYFISNIQTGETFFFDNYNGFVNKKNELAKVNGGY